MIVLNPIKMRAFLAMPILSLFAISLANDSEDLFGCTPSDKWEPLMWFDNAQGNGKAEVHYKITVGTSFNDVITAAQPEVFFQKFADELGKNVFFRGKSRMSG